MGPPAPHGTRSQQCRSAASEAGSRASRGKVTQPSAQSPPLMLTRSRSLFAAQEKVVETARLMGKMWKELPAAEKKRYAGDSQPFSCAVRVRA